MSCIICLSVFFCPCLADLIFLIYLYQRWIYPVDKKRVNEFGFGGEDDQAVAETDAAKEEEKKTNWFGFLNCSRKFDSTWYCRIQRGIIYFSPPFVTDLHLEFYLKKALVWPCLLEFLLRPKDGGYLTTETVTVDCNGLAAFSLPFCSFPLFSNVLFLW